MRSYKQYCGVAKALDLVGQRWTLLIVRDLLPGPRRFTDLLLPGLTPNVLSERLKQLKKAGLVEQIELPAPASRKVWALTEEGRRLESVVLALGAFGAPHLGSREGQAMSARWMMVSLQRRYRGGLQMAVNLRIDGSPYALTLQPHKLTARDGAHATPDLSLSGTARELGALLVHHKQLEGLQVEGDGLDRFLSTLAGLTAG